MGDLIYQNSRFIFAEGRREKVLLDCTDLMSNKSRISMHSLQDQETRTIPILLAGLMEKESEYQDGTGLITALLTVLLVSELVKTSRPVRVLEYGCLGGRISRYLAEVLGAFHEESSLVCVCDRMDEAWLRQMETAEESPRINFLAGDYGRVPLAPGSFDVVLINGTVDFADPEEVILDASKLAAADGMLICCCNDSPLLKDLFRLFYEKEHREDYELDPFRILMTASASDRNFMSWEEADYEMYSRKVQEHLEQAKEIFAGRTADESKRKILKKQLLADIKEASIKGDEKRKLQLMEVRGILEDI